MPGKYARDKGVRGETEVRKILGADFKRTGHAGISSPDLSSDWAVVSVKNEVTPISLKKALEEIQMLESQDPKKNHYVAVKVDHKYLIIQRVEQFRADRC